MKENRNYLVVSHDNEVVEQARILQKQLQYSSVSYAIKIMALMGMYLYVNKTDLFFSLLPMLDNLKRDSSDNTNTE